MNDCCVALMNEGLKREIKPGTERIQKLLSLMGNPEQILDVIHVVGTNGKGSTCTMLSSIFTEAGYKTGLYTSPHLFTCLERIKINNKNISRPQFNKIYSLVDKFVKMEQSKGFELTTFEFLTAMAFKYFEMENCDIVIVEAGIGGRLDSTNVFSRNLATVITSISPDHTAILGDTIGEIAQEKCAVIKQDSYVITGKNQKKEALDVIKEQCDKKNSKLIITNDSKFSDINFDIFKGTQFNYDGKKMRVPLLGRHQIENISNVLSCVEAVRGRFALETKHIKKGLKKARIFARMQVISKKPLTILDGAHNIGSVEVLKEIIEELFPDKDCIAIVGMYKDKKAQTSLSGILSLFKEVITIPLANQRSMSLEDITTVCLKYNPNTIPKKNVNDAMNFLKDSYKESLNSKVIILFGSFSISSQISFV